MNDINWLSLPDTQKLLPPEQYAHLADNGSLTRRVRNSCSGQVEVQLIDQNTVQPGFQERKLLNIPEAAQVLPRQVYLSCDQKPMIFARTLLGLIEKNRLLTERISNLGEQSLGSVLFRDPLAIKRQMHLACLSCRHPFFDPIKLSGLRLEDNVWLRRSLYDYENCNLIVYEAFIAFSEAIDSAN